MKRVQDLTGKVFERLTVLAEAGRNPHNKVLWKCSCECGSLTTVTGNSLKAGTTRSCGCLHKEATGNRFRKHGASSTAEYEVWCAMRRRCLSPRDPEYPNYGGRGISVCQRWDSFAAFIEDMGLRPSDKHSIERLDVNRGYSPENCIWLLLEQQANNRRNTVRVTHNGVTRTLSEWASITGIKHNTLYSRLICLNWDPARALCP